MKSERYGIIHGYAQCDDCEWNDAIDIKSHRRMDKLRASIKRHVEGTGHTVTLETGNATKYSK